MVKRKEAMKGKSQKHYDSNTDSRLKKNSYDREYYRKNKPKLNASRAERKRFRNKAIKNGASVKGKDVAHTKKGLRLKSIKANRGSNSDSRGDRIARPKKNK
jgi:hypothetical protein